MGSGQRRTERGGNDQCLSSLTATAHNPAHPAFPMLQSSTRKKPLRGSNATTATTRRCLSTPPKLRGSLETALEQTGQNQPPPADNRTPAQKLHDHVHAIEPHRPEEYREVPLAYRQFCAELLLPQNVASLVVNDALSTGKKADAATVLGERYADDLKAAKSLLQKAAHLPEGARIEPNTLSPHVLAQLAVWSRHLAKAQQSRP